MLGYSLELVAIISAAVCLDGFVKDVTGIGASIVAIAVMVNFLDPVTTFSTLIIPILVTNLWQAVTSRNWKVLFKRFWLMIILFLGFLLVGADLAATLDTETLLLVLGISVTVFAAFNLVKPRERPLPPTVEHIAAPRACLAAC
tara:strand:- start:194 stop:625 length:432 start_codon:yes stop_codon:yes gene_type:complete